jgi:hypothetical protein
MLKTSKKLVTASTYGIQLVSLTEMLSEYPLKCSKPVSTTLGDADYETCQ